MEPTVRVIIIIAIDKSIRATRIFGFAKILTRDLLTDLQKYPLNEIQCCFQESFAKWSLKAPKLLRAFSLLRKVI